MPSFEWENRTHIQPTRSKENLKERVDWTKRHRQCHKNSRFPARFRRTNPRKKIQHAHGTYTITGTNSEMHAQTPVAPPLLSPWRNNKIKAQMSQMSSQNAKCMKTYHVMCIPVPASCRQLAPFPPHEFLSPRPPRIEVASYSLPYAPNCPWTGAGRKLCIGFGWRSSGWGRLCFASFARRSSWASRDCPRASCWFARRVGVTRS